MGGGIYEPNSEVVTRVRRAIARDGQRLTRALAGRHYRELYGGELLGERIKRLPPDLASAAQRYPWVANRRFYYYAEHAGAAHIARPDLADWLLQHFRAARAVHDFLKEAARKRPEVDAEPRA